MRVSACLLVGVAGFVSYAEAASVAAVAAQPTATAQQTANISARSGTGSRRTAANGRRLRRRNIVRTGNAGTGSNNPGTVSPPTGTTNVPPQVPVANAGSNNVWRPFNDSSPWNRPLPANPELAPDSKALVDDFRSSSVFGEHLDVNIARYSIPLYYADGNTPKIDVLCQLGGQGFTGLNGFNAVASVPIPQGAIPDRESDHHIAIVDRSTNTEWGLWNAHNNGGNWSCGVGATADLNGDGTRPYKPTNPTWYTSHGARACGFPLVAGLIRTDEVDAGRINHALVIAYPHIRAGFYMSPASTAQSRAAEAVNWRGIPCGGRVQLDPSVDIDALGLSRGARVVAKALQEYGAFVGDYSGALSLYAENSPSAQAHWQGILDTYDLRDKLDLSKLRVIKFGDLTDDGNGN